jgi:hypothetical protein
MAVVAAIVAGGPDSARAGSPGSGKRTAAGGPEAARPAFAWGDARHAAEIRSSQLARPSRCVVSGGLGSYAWPLKPFHQQHPIRAFFGDPRTVFRNTDDADAGIFSFHNGIDIVAEDGTTVYPVVTGTVIKVRPDEVVVTSEQGGRTFQYWHLEPKVRLHQFVRAEKSVLGTVQPGRGHVHLTEIDGSLVENPLQAGHLMPYRDSTAPSVRQLYIRGASGAMLNPDALAGSVDLTAAAIDIPPLPLPEPWTAVPVTPARVSWQLTTLDGHELLPELIAADFTVTIPPPTQFWGVYTTGTYQNFPAVGAHYFYGTAGDYLFKLTASPIDTRLLRAGRYRLTVIAADTCGNSGTLSERIRILPQPSVPPLTGATVRGAAPQGLAARLTWPRSFWTVVLREWPTGTGLVSARATIDQALRGRLFPIGLVTVSTARAHRSSHYIVVAGVFHAWAGAYASAEQIALRFPGAYPREIVQRRLRPPARLAQSKRGQYTVVVASLPVRNGQPTAETLSIAATRDGLPSVRLDRSSRFRSLRSGYILVVSGRYRTARAAADAARLDAMLYPQAYPRELIAKRARPGAALAGAGA